VSPGLRFLVGCAGLLAGGCLSSHGLLQTAHTEPPHQVRINAGAAGVFNENSDAQGRGIETSTTPEPSLRVGLTEFMDAGLSPWLGTGASLDAKVNLLPNLDRAALAPRLAAGYAFGDRSTFGLELGVIGSYRLADDLEPYAGVHFANHWFSTQNGEDSVALAPNQIYAQSRGYGDGLLKLAFGLDVHVTRGFHLMLEYAHWFPANNDQGDGYRFVSNDIVALSAAFHLSGR
jgi:hypothetical protein